MCHGYRLSKRDNYFRAAFESSIICRGNSRRSEN